MGRTTIPRADMQGRDISHVQHHITVDPVGTALVTLTMARQNLTALSGHPYNDDLAYHQLFKIRKGLTFLIDALKGQSHPGAQELSALLERISMQIAYKFAENSRLFTPEDTALQNIEQLISQNCL